MAWTHEAALLSRVVMIRRIMEWKMMDRPKGRTYGKMGRPSMDDMKQMEMQ